MRGTTKLFFGGAVALLLAACNVSTANIGSLGTSKDAEGTTPSTTFGPGDTIYASATADNVPSPVTLKWRTYTEKVPGQTDNAPIENFDASFDLADDGSSTYNLTPPPAGWPPGLYKIEVTMFLQDGKQQDQKSVSVTVNPN
jgi:hypothetical protein